MSRYGGEEIERWAWGICIRICREVGWSEGWKVRVVVPSRKRRHGEKVEEYRGVTILPTLYKIYAAVLKGRMREEVEGRRLILAG